MCVSPWQTVATHCVAGGGAVALLETVDESAVQTGLALLQAAVLLEATAPAGYTPGILSITKATFLGGLMGETHRVRGGWWVGMMCSWWKEGLNVDYREWSWLTGSEENNSTPLFRVHLTLVIISLTLSVWMSCLPLQDPESRGIWIIKGGHPLLYYCTFIAVFLCDSFLKQTQ